MIQGSIANRYARALFEEARDTFGDEQVYEHIQTMNASLKAEPELQVALANPHVSQEMKYRLLMTAAGVNCGAWTKEGTVPKVESYSPTLFSRFLRLVLEHHREDKIRLIGLVYCDLYREYHKIDRVLLETAVPVDDDTVEHLINRIKSQTGREVECEQIVKPSIIGGFRLRIGDNRYDHSYQTKLEKIKQRLCLTK